MQICITPIENKQRATEPQIKLETGEKMIEYAFLELKQIPDVRPRVSKGPLRYGSYHNYSHLPDEMA